MYAVGWRRRVVPVTTKRRVLLLLLLLVVRRRAVIASVLTVPRVLSRWDLIIVRPVPCNSNDTTASVRVYCRDRRVVVVSCGASRGPERPRTRTSRPYSPILRLLWILVDESDRHTVVEHGVVVVRVWLLMLLLLLLRRRRLADPHT